MASQLYPYVKLAGRYYPRTTRLTKLFRLLRAASNGCRQSRWHAVRLLLLFVQYRLRVRSAGLVWMPVSGESAVRARHGYRVFDPRRNLATKVFGRDTRQNVKENEVRLRREIRALAYAPALHAVGEDCNWYSEELLQGKNGDDFAPHKRADFIAVYHATIEPLLLALLHEQPLEQHSVAEYVAALDNAIAAPLATLRESDPKIEGKIQRLLRTSREQLQAARVETIYTGFTHGDFHLYNIIGEPGKAKLVDWDCKDNLSVLYDLYNFHFSNMWVGRTLNARDIGFDFAIDSLAAHLQADMPEIAQHLLENARTYRLIYYMERIMTFLTRLESKPKSMHSWLDLFLDTESALA